MTGPRSSEDRPCSSNPNECMLVVDEVTEVLCAQTAVTEILVRNAFGLFAVPMCASHIATHRRFYDGLRRPKISAQP